MQVEHVIGADGGVERRRSDALARGSFSSPGYARFIFVSSIGFRCSAT